MRRQRRTRGASFSNTFGLRCLQLPPILERKRNARSPQNDCVQSRNWITEKKEEDSWQQRWGGIFIGRWFSITLYVE